MSKEERRRNPSLRKSIDNIEKLIIELETNKKLSTEKIANYKTDIKKIISTIQLYHERFGEVMETLKNIKEIEK